VTLDQLCELFHTARQDAERWEDWEAQARCQVSWAELSPEEQGCIRAGVRAVLLESHGEHIKP
jgi:hypothetical protein